ncbi:hypothetical protein BDD12DRAFT_982711 [Trichophaea hybrida]|nr:hypothetical protein BDD12DRAFT_982711 [Trichophaea hybrida]
MLTILPTRIAINPGFTFHTSTLLTPTTTFTELLHILLQKHTDFGIPFPHLLNPRIFVLLATQATPIPVLDDASWEHARHHITKNQTHPITGLVMTATTISPSLSPSAGIPLEITGYTHTGKVDVSTWFPSVCPKSYEAFIAQLEGKGREVFPHGKLVLTHIIVYDSAGWGTTIFCPEEVAGCTKDVARIRLMFDIEREGGLSENTRKVVEVLEKLGLSTEYDDSKPHNGGIKVWEEECGGKWGYELLHSKKQKNDRDDVPEKKHHSWVSSADGTVIIPAGGIHHVDCPYLGHHDEYIKHHEHHKQHHEYLKRIHHHHIGLGHRSSKL